MKFYIPVDKLSQRMDAPMVINNVQLKFCSTNLLVLTDNLPVKNNLEVSIYIFFLFNFLISLVLESEYPLCPR
jgi:hypothetical protein